MQFFDRNLVYYLHWKDKMCCIIAFLLVCYRHASKKPFYFQMRLRNNRFSSFFPVPKYYNNIHYWLMSIFLGKSRHWKVVQKGNFWFVLTLMKMQCDCTFCWSSSIIQKSVSVMTVTILFRNRKKGTKIEFFACTLSLCWQKCLLYLFRYNSFPFCWFVFFLASIFLDA